jgi:hypothetical protein
LVIIAFPNGEDWFKANWVFRQLAEDVSQRNRNDNDVCKELELAQAIKTVVDDTISGTIEGWRPQDKPGHAMYCEALTELAKLIEQQQQTTL